MSTFTIRLSDITAADRPEVGGKAAGLAALIQVPGTWVPGGFCVRTTAFAAALAETPSLGRRVAALADTDPSALPAACAALRAAITEVALPAGLAAEIARATADLGPDRAWAVRSSATAEDLPDASFAGQHDSWLGVRGTAAILDHLRRCWASLYTDRAVAYRRRQGIDAVHMGVVVQEMVAADAAGVLFTADPTSGHRRVCVVEAVPGLGDAYVAGAVTPDHVEFREGQPPRRRGDGPPVLSDEALSTLVDLGRHVADHLGAPQDIEWCRAGDRFAFVQSRPITTLFPIPASPAPPPRLFLSVGHQQMMTDPMRPLGLSVYQRLAARPMYAAGGRLFVDVTDDVTTPGRRSGLLAMMGRLDPLTADAVRGLLDRGDFPERTTEAGTPPLRPPPGPTADAALVATLVAEADAEIARSAEVLAVLSGAALLDALDAELLRVRQGITDPRCMAVVLTAAATAAWLDDHLRDWIGEPAAADILSRSLPDNVGAEMGLVLLDVADTIRPHPEVLDWLGRATDTTLLDGLSGLPGGPAVQAALTAFLDRFGMRCPGEIDLTRPRWHETPTALVAVLASHVNAYGPGESRRRFESGRQQAEAKRGEILARVRALDDGEARAAEVDRQITRLRTLTGFREFPKYTIVRRLDLARRALQAEARRLVAAGRLSTVEDLDFLHLDEVRGLVEGAPVDPALLAARRLEHARNEARTPPRVLTSDGEAPRGDYRHLAPRPGLLVGLAVSVGRVEGRARVVRTFREADLRPGDILVTRFTDPGWTAAFAAVSGLVTEVGGLMTHGAVIAREYGLPAVVGVVDATRHITDGQWLRVDGTAGTVEILDGPSTGDSPTA